MSTFQPESARATDRVVGAHTERAAGTETSGSAAQALAFAATMRASVGVISRAQRDAALPLVSNS